MIISPIKRLNPLGSKSNSWSSYWATHSPSDLTLTLILGGVKIDFTDNSGGTAEHEIWGKSDSGIYVLIETLAVGIVTKNDITDPVDLRYYKVRGKKSSSYSPFNTEESIAMLGAELVVNGSFDSSTGWTLGVGWVISNGSLNVNGVGFTYAFYEIAYAVGKTYLKKFTVSNYVSGSVKIQIGSNDSGNLTHSSNGLKKEYVLINNIIDPNIYVASGADGFIGILDDISIKEVISAS